MKLLVFEYSTCISSSSLQVEGLYMLRSILSDLDKLSFDVDYLINKSFDDLSFNNCKKIVLEDSLSSWLKFHIDYYDCVLFIAPEDDNIQCILTRFFEKSNIKIIGSNSAASCICCSKNKTYENTPADILKIPSKLIDVDKINYENINSHLDDYSLIIKPDNKTCSDLIYIIRNIEDLKKAIRIYKTNNLKKCLLQRYINGKAISVSCLCNKDNLQIISINTQEMINNNNRIIYNGCRTNIKHPLKDEIETITEKIIKSINGLKGYVGIDYIIAENKVYFVEINSRITTPYINLQKSADKNLTEHMINICNEENEIIHIKKEDMFIKTMV